MRRYNPTEIEPKWQQIWRDDQRYKAPDNSDKPKYYVTGMFPYPSGAGMHTGHFFEHSIVDANARFHRALGENVMYPMGFDNFGLPAENYAIKTGVSPQKATADNIANFKNQLNRVGASIDWSREVQTSDPSYYKWTQWVFTKLFERGLAYQKESLQWWCPIDQTVLANEQVVNGKCWRHDGPDDPPAEKKSIKQWFFKITDYADALLEEIPDLDWPDKIKTAQTNWIGRSVGAEIAFEVCHSQSEGSSSDTETRSTQSVVRHSRLDRESSKGQSTHDDWILSQAKDDDREKITVFSTRPDTIFGATFLVLAPEHPLSRLLATDDMRETVEAYIDAAIKKSEIDRTNDTKDKTGVFTGSYALNPASGAKVPIWIADYVLGGYGTGAVMGVPAHDERDYEFAMKFELPIIQVVSSYVVREDDLAPRDDWPTREKEVIDAIITDGKGNYLLQIETFPDGTKDVHFVGGGVDDSDESVEAAVRREVVEEVGYTNITSFRLVAPFNAAFVQRKLRKRNHRTWGAFYEVVVDPTVQVKSEIDDGRHEIMWVPKKDVEKSITKDWEHHKKGWRDYLDGRTVDIEVREGILVNSGLFDGTPTSEAREKIVAWLMEKGAAKEKTMYKMRDWLISRQRYWGAPIPIIHCPEHGAVAVPEKDLPVLLPEIEDYAPKGDGKSPLARQDDWVNTTCPTCGKPAKRETDVMDGYACSSWYLIRYADPRNTERAWDPALAKIWEPVDMYVGGDHAVAHLLYVRFWNHVFYDMGLVPTKEPVKKLVYHGLIQAEDGTKMSKSKGNVVDPLEVIDAGYGADALRTFELFLGPINENSSWSSKGIAGVYRFLNRFWTLVQEYQDFAADTISEAASPRRASPTEVSGRAAELAPDKSGLRQSSLRHETSAVEPRVSADVSETASAAGNRKLETITHRTIKKVTDDIHRLSFNTAIASLMECVNDLYKLKIDGFTPKWKGNLEKLIQLLQPFAPHMAAELWQQLGHNDQLDFVPWPKWDETKITSETIIIVVQVNGKVRSKLEVAPDSGEEDVKKLALEDENVQKFVLGDPKKVIYIKGRLVSIVV